MYLTIKKYILIIVGLLFGQVCFGQTDQFKRIDIQKKKIKTIKYSTYTEWDKKNQKPFYKGVLTDVLIEHYDTLGNLTLKTNEAFDKSISDMMNLRYEYQYDNYGNVIAGHLQNKFLPMNKKWEYKYDTNERMIEKTTFDLHNNPHQTTFYFYDQFGFLVKDSLTQQGKPLLITTYYYNNAKLDKTITLWAKKVKFQLSDETKYYYNNKGLLIKEVSVYNQSTDYKIGGSTTTIYKYDNNNNLIKTQIDKRVIEFFYDKKGNIIKKSDYRELPIKKYSFKIPSYDIIEYEYYEQIKLDDN